VKRFVQNSFERSTAATDLMLATAAVIYAKTFYTQKQRDPLRAYLWSSVFVSLGLAAGLGAAAHGLHMSSARHRLLWHHIYACLSVSVALMAAIATYDRWGSVALRRSILPLLSLAILCFIVTRILRRSFLVFVVYEALAMLYALVLYGSLVRRRYPGSQAISMGIALSVCAAFVQRSRLHARVGCVDLDHNGLFHLLQLVALPFIGHGALMRIASEYENTAHSD
jgi:cation transport ATPase